MPNYGELAFRDCPWCGVKSIAMSVKWSQVAVGAANGARRSWGAMSCPRCGGVVVIEVDLHGATLSSESKIPNGIAATEMRAVPSGESQRYEIDHLPDDVARFFHAAIRVLDAGVPDAAAVQLRRTLEAAAAHKGVNKKTLVQSVQEMINAGLVTKDFGDALTHVRKLGNLGAHYTDEELTGPEVERALRFTTQFLRNLFEVPGELAELSAETPEEEGGTIPA